MKYVEASSHLGLTRIAALPICDDNEDVFGIRAVAMVGGEGFPQDKVQAPVCMGSSAFVTEKKC